MGFPFLLQSFGIYLLATKSALSSKTDFSGSLVANCTGSISSEAYEALESLYYSARGWYWIWNPPLPSTTVWHFPSELSDPCSDSWQGINCVAGSNDTTCVIQTLLLDSRNLTGTIASELGNLKSLEALYLYNNSLTGVIPSALGHLVNLEVLGLYENSLVGTLPFELGNQVNLKALYLFDNSLVGTIPPQLGNLVNLEAVFLNSNSLSGSVPSELGNLWKLTVISLYSNTLVGAIPSELGNLVNLGALYLFDNSLVGTIPSELANLVNVEQLYLFSNSLVGTVPSELYNLASLEGLDLSVNSLSGTLPLRSSTWPLLQLLNISSNALTGAVDVPVNSSASLHRLLVLDISDNRFSGAVTDSLFLLPSLQTIILSQNCFSGTLPSSMCSNDHLQDVVMDLLTANCGRADTGILQGFVVRQYMRGSIPTCVWNSPSIRTLHLLGNGLTGSVAELVNNSRLSVLALGSNQLTGSIPRSFQTHNFAQLDLSINRFSGTLETDLFVNQTATVYDLSVNRLSGDIPAVLYGTFSRNTINVLEGNLFGCRKNDVPTSDVNHVSYQCGSDDYEYSFFGWIAGVSMIILIYIAIRFQGDGADQRVRTFKGAAVYQSFAGQFRCLSICVVGLIGYVSVKAFGGNFASTHTVQYWWTSTIAFTHNWFIAVYLFLLLVASCVAFVLAMMRFTTAEKGLSVVPYSHSIPAVFKCIFAHLVNIVIVTAVNAIYILVAFGHINSFALLSVQAALGIFKLMWSVMAIPRLLTLTTSEPSLPLSHWLFMVLFVFLGAPFTSSFSESSSCFLYVLTRPNAIGFSFIIFLVELIDICSNSGCTFVPVSVGQTFQQSVVPPWIYSYQCSSAVITAYAPVLMLSYLVSGFLVPAALFILSNCSRPLVLSVKKELPVVLLQMTSADGATSLKLLENSNVAKLGRRMTVKYILNFAVMLTFGLAVPLLAVAVVFDTVVSLGIITVIIDKFIGLHDLDNCRVNQEFWSSFSLSNSEGPHCCYIVLGYVGVFWSLFAFDWIGDVYGPLPGGLVMLVPLITPMMIGFILLRMKRLMGRFAGSARQTDNLELTETLNPVVLPQATQDEFSVYDL
jgi:Leucine-rich repeat (LRR) protein